MAGYRLSLAAIIFLLISVGSRAEASGGGASASPTPEPVPTVDVNARTDSWVPNGKKMEPLVGRALRSEDSVTIAPKRGQALAVILIASWCEACQELVESVKTRLSRYRAINARFVFAFSHDAAQDAQDFAKQYGIESDSVLLSDKSFASLGDKKPNGGLDEGPPLPSVFLTDRREWLVGRWLNAKPSEVVTSLDDMLRLMTAF